MVLKLNGIDVECVIGERPDERIRMQHLKVDAELTIDGAAAETDALEDTVDYAELTKRIRAALREAKCRMIERAAKVAGEVCLADRKVDGVKITVTKTGAIAHLESASAIWEQTK